MKTQVQVILIGGAVDDVERIKYALDSQHYVAFPQTNTYSVNVGEIKNMPDDLENTVIIIGDYPNDKTLNTLAQTEQAPKTICIGDFKRKDHIEMAGMHWCSTNFGLLTELPELIDKIIAKQKR